MIIVLLPAASWCSIWLGIWYNCHLLGGGCGRWPMISTGMSWMLPCRITAHVLLKSTASLAFDSRAMELFSCRKKVYLLYFLISIIVSEYVITWTNKEIKYVIFIPNMSSMLKFEIMVSFLKVFLLSNSKYILNSWFTISALLLLCDLTYFESLLNFKLPIFQGGTKLPEHQHPPRGIDEFRECRIIYSYHYTWGHICWC